MAVSELVCDEQRKTQASGVLWMPRAAQVQLDLRHGQGEPGTCRTLKPVMRLTLDGWEKIEMEMVELHEQWGRTTTSFAVESKLIEEEHGVRHPAEPRQPAGLVKLCLHFDQSSSSSWPPTVGHLLWQVDETAIQCFLHFDVQLDMFTFIPN